jgi:hypothetical protein
MGRSRKNKWEKWMTGCLNGAPAIWSSTERSQPIISMARWTNKGPRLTGESTLTEAVGCGLNLENEAIIIVPVFLI